MNYLETISLALLSIKSNKMRSILTMLGIIIGISSVITITTIGSSLKATLSSSLNELGGTNVITCYVDAIYPETEEEWQTWEYPEMSEEDYLSLEDMEEFLLNYENEVSSIVASSYVGEGSYINGDNTAKVEITGNTGGILDSLRIKILAGRDIAIRDSQKAKSTAVVSDWFVKYACGGKSPIGEKIDVVLGDGSVVSAYVVGIYEYNETKLGYPGSHTAEKDTVTPMYISYALAEKYSTDITGISNFQILTKEGVDPTAFSEEAKSYFNTAVYGDSDNFCVSTYDMASELGVINKLLSLITVAISVIAAISLVVGGIGVMNIMLVSVVERTREIGIRKALGAKPSVIQRQFLTEAVVICIIGGLLGILLGLMTGFIMTVFGGQIISVLDESMAGIIKVSYRPSIIAIIISVMFSMLTGIVFGFYPAKRAADLNPIDALRYE